MKKTFLIVLLLFALCAAEPKKLSKSRGSSSSRGSSKRVNHNPQPTSISQAAPASAPASAPKSSLFSWQEQPAQRKQAPPKQTQTHSYPSSNTGLSGGGPAKQPTHQQESIQKSVPSQHSSPSQSNSQPSHSYPASNGLSGSSGAGYPQSSSGLSGGQGQNRPASGAGNPQQQGGLSGTGAAAPPPYSAGGGSNYQQGPPPAYSNSGAYPKQPPPYSAGNPASNYGNNYHQPPPAYSPNYGGYGGHGGYGGQGGYGGSGGYHPSYTPQMPGYFGNHGNNGFGGGMSRSGSMLKGVGIAGAGVGTILTGLALWNLARSTGQHHHTVIYDNRGQPVAVAPNNSTEPVVDPILGDLVNCTLTVSSDTGTEVLGIPCAIATSFTPGADVKESGVANNPNDNTKCTVTVVTKAGREFSTTIPCSTLLNSAAENNVTEAPLANNGTDVINGDPSQTAMIQPGNPNMSLPSNPPNMSMPDNPIMDSPVPAALPLFDSTKLNCTLEPGDVRDPINPCYSVTTNLTVIPLETNLTTTTTPASA